MKKTFGADLGELAGDDIRQWQGERGIDHQAGRRAGERGKMETILSLASIWIRTRIGVEKGQRSCRPGLTIRPADATFSDPSLSHAVQPNNPT